MLGHAEALQSMVAWPAGYPDENKNEQVRTIFKQHADAFKKTQSDDGRWHQLLNDTKSFRETSVVSNLHSARISLRAVCVARNAFRNLCVRSNRATK